MPTIKHKKTGAKRKLVKKSEGVEIKAKWKMKMIQERKTGKKTVPKKALTQVKKKRKTA